MQDGGLFEKRLLRKGLDGDLIWSVASGGGGEEQAHPAVHTLHRETRVEHPPCGDRSTDSRAQHRVK